MFSLIFTPFLFSSLFSFGSFSIPFSNILESRDRHQDFFYNLQFPWVMGAIYVTMALPISNGSIHLAIRAINIVKVIINPTANWRFVDRRYPTVTDTGTFPIQMNDMYI